MNSGCHTEGFGAPLSKVVAALSLGGVYQTVSVTALGEFRTASQGYMYPAGFSLSNGQSKRRLTHQIYRSPTSFSPSTLIKQSENDVG